MSKNRRIFSGSLGVVVITRSFPTMIGSGCKSLNPFEWNLSIAYTTGSLVTLVYIDKGTLTRAISLSG